MQNLLKRNKTMFTLSIIALILFVLLTVYRLVSTTIEFEDISQIVLNGQITSFLTSLVIFIGYISIYVLWTPTTQGEERKRPKWQFLLLIISIAVSLIISIIFAIMQANAGYNDFWRTDTSANILLISNISYYLFLQIILAMRIILLVKAERKAKKIMIVYVAFTFLSLVGSYLRPLIFLTGDYQLDMARSEIYSTVSFIVFLAFNLLLLIFTIIYTKQKYDEVKLPEIDKGY